MSTGQSRLAMVALFGFLAAGTGAAQASGWHSALSIDGEWVLAGATLGVARNGVPLGLEVRGGLVAAVVPELVNFAAEALGGRPAVGR